MGAGRASRPGCSASHVCPCRCPRRPSGLAGFLPRAILLPSWRWFALRECVGRDKGPSLSAEERTNRARGRYRNRKHRAPGLGAVRPPRSHSPQAWISMTLFSSSVPGSLAPCSGAYLVIKRPGHRGEGPAPSEDPAGRRVRRTGPLASVHVLRSPAPPRPRPPPPTSPPCSPAGAPGRPPTRCLTGELCAPRMLHTRHWTC